jgi:tRNA nucleotidyltransferase (CCA-adding enzyme)
MHLLTTYPFLEQILAHIKAAGGTCYLVGGAVRDLLQEKPIKDLDLEVHGLEPSVLEALLKEHISIIYAGKSFGVFKATDYPIDFSLPRRDSSGRHPDVAIDPNMGIENALRRRDLTINSMAINLHTHILHDPFQGRQDLADKILRATDLTLFSQDPLRFFRVMQCMSRFAMEPDSALNTLCKTITINAVSAERIENEFDKLMLQSARPSLGLRWLEKIGRLQEILPELYPTLFTQQEPDWHPEVSVFEHLMQSLDCMATSITTKQEPALHKITDQIMLYQQDRRIALWAALCHDLGKTTTTRFIEGRLRSWGHEEAGVAPTKQLLARVIGCKKLRSAVAALVYYHMRPGALVSQHSSPAAYKKLAAQLQPPLNLAFLSLLFHADRNGRNGLSSLPLTGVTEAVTNFIRTAEAAGVLYSKEEPILSGNDLLAAGLTGPALGKALEKAYDAQLAKNIHAKELLIKIALKK